MGLAHDPRSLGAAARHTDEPWQDPGEDRDGQQTEGDGKPLGYADNHDAPCPAPMLPMLRARARTLAACEANAIIYLDTVTPLPVRNMRLSTRQEG